MQTKTYNLFGKQYSPSNSILEYNTARQFIYRKAIESKAEFDELYATFTNIEQVLSAGKAVYYKRIDLIAEDCVKHFKSMRIFDYEIAHFEDFHRKNFSDKLQFPKIMDVLTAQYELLVDKKDKEETPGNVAHKTFEVNDSENQKKSLTDVASGTLETLAKYFGKGGLVQDAVEVIKTVAGEIQATKKKSELFSNPDLFPTLSMAVYEDCFNLHLSYVDILRRNGRDINQISEPAMREASYDFGELNPNTPPDELLDKMIKILELDPYKLEYYRFLIENFQDANGEVEQLADDFGYLPEVQRFKQELAEKHFHDMQKSTIAESVASMAQLAEYCTAIGLAAVPATLTEIMDKHLPKLAVNYFIDLANGASSLKINENTTPHERAQAIAAAATGFNTIERCKDGAAKLAEYCAPMGDPPADLTKTLADKLLECKIKAADDFLQSQLTAEKSVVSDDAMLQAEETLLAIEIKLRDYCVEIELIELVELGKPEELKNIPALTEIDKIIRTVETTTHGSREKAHTVRMDKSAERKLHELPKSTIATAVESAARLAEYCTSIGFDSVPEKLTAELNAHMLILADNYFIELAGLSATLKIVKNDSEEERLDLIKTASHEFITIESCKTAAATLAEYCASMGYVPEKLTAALADKLQENKEQAANDFLSEEIANTAIPALKTEETLLAMEENLIAYCDEIELAIEGISALHRVDKMIRTVENIEFETREIAHQARNEQAAIEEIVANNGQLYRGDFLAILTEISSGKFTTKIRGHYEEIHKRRLAEFDQKLEDARHYAEQKNTGKWFTGITNIVRDVSSLLGYSEGEKAWQELTQNGKYDLEVVGSYAKSTEGSTPAPAAPPEEKEGNICSSCGTVNSTSQKFCGECGERL
ncbi:MAG: hypothetical protein FWG68_06320 [Defluviitaleaceae bacterium]|nr:hypothetical protein [Defluviitaleaceae bacterium]